MEETLRNHGELDLWFSEIKKWRRYECCETRKVWLEIYGVPPHGWLWENFSKIAETWGRLICLGKPIYCTDSFESMKVRIVTDIFRRIDEELLLTLEDGGYRVWIKEVGSTTLIPCSLAVETIDSNDEVLGFEDIEDDMAVDNEVAQSDLRKTGPVIDDQDGEAIQKTPGLHFNSNSNQADERSTDKDE